MPFPSSLPVHPSWSEHHQPVASGTLTGRLVISLPTASVWSPETGAGTPAEGEVLYDGAFRAQSLAGETSPQVDAAGQPVTIRSYLLVVDAAAPGVPAGARAKVHVCPDDAALVDKTFVVVGTSYGSRRFERDLYAELDLTNQETP